MKKFICVLFTTLVLLTAFGCGKEDRIVDEKTTLMIYMIGSDLEAKGGSATADLKEIEESGIDLKKSDIVIYAGGSRKWHNEIEMSEEMHTVLHLTDTGFQIDKTLTESSMGEPGSLTEFLNFSYENYPSDKYALILWNHGNGPVIGYGKDMLHDNDSLTLKEMQTALEKSPFSAENKLEWVGFDACMMASAELACVFDDYANYLVASQEIEPYFGWNYSFLSELGKTDCKSMLKKIAADYLQTCEEYYESKGYSDRDTTLSVIDLSEVKNMESAIETLFAKASSEVGEKYNSLTSRRVETRALGRASTGSEYDLIDLGDMAAKLADIYPEEAKTLIKAIEKAVVANETNTESLCGLSLYYPFYNKSYYETDWAAVYEDLGLFSEYRAYLQGYSEIWLKKDMLDTVAKSFVPKKIKKNTYNLELTAEQAEVFADAKYYVLKKEGHGLYTPLFVSTNVEKKGNTLVTEFDGNIIYGKDKFNHYFIPVSQEHDSVGDITRYSIYVNAVNAWADWLKTPDNYERKAQGLNYQIAVDNKEKEISVSSLVPWDTETDASTLVGGKFEEIDLSPYSEYFFPGAPHKYLTRYDNGTVCPFSEWYTSAFESASEVPIGDGLSFIFEPLISGEYYIVFEIEDTQGNRYCSEPAAINGVKDMLEEEIVPDPIVIDWKNGNEVSLGEFSGVQVSMRYFENENGSMKYTVVCRNTNDFMVNFLGTDVTVNDEIYIDDVHFSYVDLEKPINGYIAPGETKILDESGIDFGIVEDLGVLTQLDSLSFTFSITHAEKCTTLVNDQTVSVNFPDNHRPAFAEDFSFFTPEEYAYPCIGIHASEQQIYDDGQVRFTLMGLGGIDHSESNMTGAVKIENYSDETKYLSIPTIAFDGIIISDVMAVEKVEPGYTVYQDFLIGYDVLKDAGIASASKVDLRIQSKNSDWIGGFSEINTYSVVLDKSGQPAKFNEGSKVIFEENGIRIALQEIGDNAFGGYTWSVTVVNESESDYQLDVSNVSLNGKEYDSYVGFAFESNYIGAGEKAVVEINYFRDKSDLDQLSSKIVFMDISGEEILYTSSETIDFVKNRKPIK